MLDTIRIISPELTADIDGNVKALCNKQRVLFDTETGEKEWEFFTGEISKTWDSRIGLKLITEKLFIQNGMDSAMVHQISPRLQVECSIHKCMMGHNVWGGPEDFKASIAWLVGEISYLLGVPLPDYLAWSVPRIDWTETFKVPNLREWFANLKHMRYPRTGERKVTIRETTIDCSTSTVYVKLYQKEPEFRHNDYFKVCRVMGKEVANQLQTRASEMLRCEVEFRARKLKQLFGVVGRDVYVAEIRDNVLREAWGVEMGKILQFDGSVPRLYCDTPSVLKRLMQSAHSTRMQKSLMSTWQMFSAVGEEQVKQFCPKNTFSTHKRLLKELGISWSSTDAMLIDKEVVQWAPRIGCPEHDGGESPEVLAILHKHRVAM